MLTEFSLTRTFVVLVAVAIVASVDLMERMRWHRNAHTLFACVLGTALSVGLIAVSRIIFLPGAAPDPSATAFGVVLVIILWRALFGDWEARVKATMLGTFLFWLLVSVFSRATPDDRQAQMLAAVVAIVPAVIWCMLFLKYHRERLSRVILAFLAGVLSTLPILFYDALVRADRELDLFLIRVTPQSFNVAAESFVNRMFHAEGTSLTVGIMIVTFLLVGLMEEGSKFWVLRRSAQHLFSSIDDALQLSVIVAIGLAFAENVVNPVYFRAFIQDVLSGPAQTAIASFVSNVTGRSILTTMVHIVSTGVVGYTLGVCIFAKSYLQELRERGRSPRVLGFICRVLRTNEEVTFRRLALVFGFVSAVVLHAVFNVLVSLTDVIPGNPQTIGDLLSLSPNSFLHLIPILVLPTLLYVVGGFWLLTGLFLRRMNTVERGTVVLREELVIIEEESGS